MNAKYLTLALGLVMLASCGDKKKEEEANAAAAAATAKPQVKVAKVQTQSIPQTETYTATVESDVKNNITPNMAYRIEQILVDVGDRVSKGQCLVKLDESALNQMKLQIENQKIELGRTEQLFNVGGASKSEYDNMKTQVEVLETQYRQLAQNTQLYSPISGVVTARNYDNGDMYGGLPILTIEQTNPVKLMINVSENRYKDIHKGLDVDITLDAYEGETFSGKVTIVNPTVDAVTHTFPVEITINNKDQRVRPGMFARATVNYGSQDHVVIPDEALVKQIGAGDRYVYVYDAKKGTVSYNRVELGKHLDKYYEIFSGVNSGDQVVIAGQARLNNGKAVEVVK
ncbi:MAG: efflux RND transporter periplasmic adaptor subunit [Bacteroidaceae bacterium]|nr:efflux RND transporter periplasmic adaptor subunit [Bacteroidaceae bacterium]